MQASNENISFISVDGTLYQKCYELRTEIFFKNQTNAHDLIQDKYEPHSKFAVLTSNNEIVSHLRFTELENIGLISQMFTINTYQNLGYGKRLIKYIETYAIGKGIEKIQLNARTTAIPFYDALGYVTQGALFYSAKTSLPHFTMVKHII